MRRLLFFVAAGFCFAASPMVLTQSDASAKALLETEIGREARANRRVRELENLEEPLRQVRKELAQCAEIDCLTPSEASAVAFSIGPDRKMRGRFILEVRGGGPWNPNQLRNERLLFLNSERNFRDFGVLILAIEPDTIERLLAPVIASEEGDLPKIESVSGAEDRQKLSRSLVKRMLAQFEGKRLIVDGEVGLQWIEYLEGWTRQRHGRGYHQVWVRVTSPDQIKVVTAE